MVKDSLLNSLRVVLLIGIFVILLLQVVDVAEETGAVAYDTATLLDLIAESGNVNPAPHLAERLLDSRKILLTSDINSNSTKQVVASLLILNDQDSTTPIDLYVRTNGGYYDDAFAVVDAMRVIDAPVNTYAIGGCHSSGVVIVAAGTGQRVAYENAILMVHDNLSEDRSQYDVDTQENARMRAFWGAFDQLPAAWFSKPCDDLYYVSSEQALDYGLVDSILSAE